jgi:hypothetical protein
MKRSDFERAEEKHLWRSEPFLAPVDRKQLAVRNAEAAERAGITWDPEEPEVVKVLWESRPADVVAYRYRLLASGVWQQSYGPEWATPVNLRPDMEPLLSELARRILEEKKRGGPVFADSYAALLELASRREGKLDAIAQILDLE